MKLRPLNDTLIVKMDNILKHEGLIILPEKNSEEKISPFGTIVSAGKDCEYPFKEGQRIIIDRFIDKPLYFELEGEKYRFIKEHYIHAVIE